MYNGNGRPLSKKKQVQLMIALTILAWATQTLRHQWGYGAVVPPDDSINQPADPTANSPAAAPTNAATAENAAAVQETAVRETSVPDADPSIGKESFVPSDGQASCNASLELRAQATIVGGEVKLKQICRWSEQDNAMLSPLADFVVDHIKPGIHFRSLTLTELKSTLQDAGFNVARLDIVGAGRCTVTREDFESGDQSALNEWIDAQQPSTQPATSANAMPAPSVAAVLTPATGAPASGVASDPWAGAGAQGVSVTAATGSDPTPAAPPSMAAAIPAALTESPQYHSLRDLLMLDLASRIHISADQLEMSFRLQDQRVLKLSEPAFHFQIDPLRARDLGDVVWNVTIEAGGQSHQVSIRAQARAWQRQLVLTRPVDVRQVIQPTDFVERRTLVDSLAGDPPLTADQLVNEQAAQNLKPGDILTARTVDAVPLVKAGQLVTITVAEGGVRIKTVGTAMESAGYGQTIRVRNEVTRDVFTVTMTGPQEATLGSISTDSPALAAAKAN
jgi:flagella basal body P-ring formation protein FlgA